MSDLHMKRVLASLSPEARTLLESCQAALAEAIAENTKNAEDARAEGAEAMRERCALLCENNSENAGADGIALAAAIRALDVEDSGGKP